MADFPYMPLWVADYLADTVHFTTAEHGAYLLILMAMWVSPDCSVPNDDVYLARTTRLSMRNWKRMRETVTRCLSPRDKHTYTQKRLLIEREKIFAKSSALRANAKKRWSKKMLGNDANALQMHMQSEPYPESDTDKREPSPSLPVPQERERDLFNENRTEKTDRSGTRNDLRTNEQHSNPPKRYNAEIPVGIDTPEFRTAWELWRQYKADSPRGGNWNISAQRLDLSWLERLGPDRAKAAIEYTIRGSLNRLDEDPGMLRREPGSEMGRPYVTREKIVAWCRKKGFSKLAPIVAGKFSEDGKYYGKPVTAEERFNDIMERELNDYQKIP